MNSCIKNFQVIPILISAIVSTKRLAKFLALPEVDCSIPWRKSDPNEELSFEVDKNDKSDIPLIIDRNECNASDETDSRISLNMNNKFKDIEYKNQLKNIEDDMCCTIKDGSFAWILNDNKEGIPILKDINISIPKEKLTLIVGPIGCGKSSLLSAMIGEMVRIRGHINWSQNNSFIGYVADSPWLINMSLQDNITFGFPFDSKRYYKVIKACALQPDIDILPSGDATEIGERGINLSGGQKQRIALARAIYSSANTIVLDDTLSALDPIVGAHVFRKAIKVFIIKIFIFH